MEKRRIRRIAFDQSSGASPDDCAWWNTRKVNWKLNEEGWSGRVLVAGTDANSRDGDETSSGWQWRCSYAGTNGDMSDGRGCDDSKNANQVTRSITTASSRQTYWRARRPTTGRIKGATAAGIGSTSSSRSSATATCPKPVNSGRCRSNDDSDTTNDCWSDHRSIRSMIYY